MRKVILSVAILALSVGTVQAAPFTNGGFETATGGYNPSSGAYTTLGSGNTDLSGWSVSGTVDLVNTNYLAPDFIASNGNNSVDLNGSSTGGVSQTFDTAAGQKYTVKFDLNINPYFGATSGTKDMLVTVGGYSNVFGYPNASHLIGQGGPWQSHSFTFTAGAGSSSTLNFQSLFTAGCCWGPELDNVSVSVAGVPEPATWSLMLLGVAGLGGALRVRRRAVAV